jgi:hypothetical protein
MAVNDPENPPPIIPILFIFVVLSSLKVEKETLEMLEKGQLFKEMLDKKYSILLICWVYSVNCKYKRNIAATDMISKAIVPKIFDQRLFTFFPMMALLLDI